MADKSRLQQMQTMHEMCKREVEQLQYNLTRFLVESVQMQSRIFPNSVGVGSDGDTSENVCELLAFDRYMSLIGAVINLTRKFNIHLQLNGLNKAVLSDSNLEQVGTSRLYQEPLQLNFSSKYGGHRLNFGFETMQSIENCDPTNNCSSADISEKGQPTREHVFQLNESNTSASTSNPFVFDNRNVRLRTPQINSSGSSSTSTWSFIRYKDLSAFIEGFRFSAAITYVGDYERLVFYVCQMGNSDLRELSNMTNLQRYSRSQPPANEEVFGVSLQNNCILRAVLQPDQDYSTGALNALLIDFGEVVALNDFSQLFYVPWKYKNIPAQAIKCVLVGLCNANGDRINKSRECLVAELQRNEFREKYFIVVDRLGRVLFLQMIESQEERKEYGLMQPDSPFLHGSKDGLSTNDSNLSLPMSNDKKWNSVFEAQTVAEKLESEKTTGEECISKTSLQNDTVINVHVTHVAGVDCFYAHIEGESLLEPLFWSGNELNPVIKIYPPHLNELVYAQYAKDELWYRAKVIELDSERSLFKVFYVDYGNTESVPLHQLAECKLNTDVEPFRAVRCRLADISDITSSDEIVFNQALQMLVVVLLNQNFTVRVLGRNKDELLVRIVDKEFIDVPEMLFSKGYAKRN